MIKIKYKDFDIECNSIDDAIKFADNFCPPDKLEVKVAEEDFLEDKEFELNIPDRDEANARAYLGIKDVRGYGKNQIHIYYKDGKNVIIDKCEYLKMLCEALKELEHPHREGSILEDLIKHEPSFGTDYIPVECGLKQFSDDTYGCILSYLRKNFCISKVFEHLDPTKKYISHVRLDYEDPLKGTITRMTGKVWGLCLYSILNEFLKPEATLVDELKKENNVKLEQAEKPKIPQPINNPLMATIGSKHIEIGNPPKPNKVNFFDFDVVKLAPKKKRGRPKKVTEHDDKVVAIDGFSEKGVPLAEEDFEDVTGKEFVENVCESLAESIIKESKKSKEDLIMGIDDVAKELSKNKAMIFTEEALRKIFQKAYKPALKTDIKATYPLTQLDPQMCNRFITEVSDKLGIKCTLSYKVDKTGFNYILMK